MKAKWPLINRFQRFLREPTHELNRWQRSARFTIDLTRHCAGELKHDRAGQMAAALTYHTVFSLLPMLVLMLVVTQMFLGEDDREKFKKDIVNLLVGTTKLAAEASTGAPEAAGADEPGEADEPDVEGRLETDDPAMQAENARQAELDQARSYIGERVEKAINELGKAKFGSIGVVGLLVFIYGATGLLATIERSFNQLFGIERSRPWFLRLPLYYTVITLGPVVLAIGQLVQKRMFDLIRQDTSVAWLAGPLGGAMPFLTSWLVLYLMYVLLPNTKVSMRAAAVGSFVAAVVWVIGAELFGYYVESAVAVRNLYGSLGLLPLFLLWLWLSWLALLFGLELTYTLQAMKGQKFKHAQHAQAENLVDATWMIPVAAQVAAAFERGAVCTIEQISKQTDLAHRTVQRMVDALEGAGLVHQVDQGEGSGYTPARPSEQITVDEILGVAKGLLPGAAQDDGDPAWDLVKQIGDAAAGRTETMTLADLAKGR
ncbi:MAG: hypothetical protein CMJ49_10125 [Planctomycetaceae bacterium]|nr:hypothetical protein [Planctomycetaceae bacterium]